MMVWTKPHTLVGNIKINNNFKGQYMLSALFWNFRQRRLAVSYRRFGTTYRSHLQESSSPRRI